MTNVEGILRNANNEKLAIKCSDVVSDILHSEKKETKAFFIDVKYVPDMAVLFVRQITK